jgi:TolB protein
MSIAAITILLFSASPVQLTTDGLIKSDPVFLPSGEEVVYSVQEQSRLMTLVRKNLSTQAVTRLHQESTRPELKPMFAADGVHYVYLRSDGNQQLHVYRGEIDKEEGRRVTEGRNPCFLPDGQRVLYSKLKDDAQEIVSCNLQGGDERQLTRFSEPNCFNNWPHVSADGNQVVFCTSRDGDIEIYRMQIDGSQPTRLTQSAGRDIRPAWSPDGKRIAFASQRAGQMDLYVMNADGSEVKRLTDSEESDDYPAWHPSGKQLVYVAEREGKQDLYVIEVPQ